MYSFKDFSTVQYAGGETEMQDFYAYKRKKSLAEEGTEKIRANFKQSRHPQLKVTDSVKEAEAAKAKPEPVDEAKDPQTLSKIKARLKKKPMVKVSVTKPVGYRIADIGPGGAEHNVQTG